jgi:hypothetical protein
VKRNPTSSSTNDNVVGVSVQTVAIALNNLKFLHLLDFPRITARGLMLGFTEVRTTYKMLHHAPETGFLRETRFLKSLWGDRSFGLSVKIVF